MATDPSSSSIQEARSILSRYAALLSTNLLTSALGFATILAITRKFGDEGLGQISLAQAWVSYALIAGTCGTEIYAIRTVAARPAELGRMIGSVATARALLGIPIYLVLAGITFAFPQLRDIRPLILLSGLSLFSTAGLLLWVPQALHRSHIYGLANLAIQGLYLGFVFGGLGVMQGLTVVPIARLLAEFLVAVGLWRWIASLKESMAPPMPLRDLCILLRKSAPLAATQIFRGLALGSDLIILGGLVSRIELGHYAGALKLFMLLLSLGTAYFVIQLPRMAQVAGSAQATARELHRSLKRVMLPAAAGVILLAAIAAPLLRGLFGAPFATAAPALDILGLALLANLAARHYSQVLVSRGRQATDLHLSALSAATHVAAKLLFVPFLGITGAALGMLLGEGQLMVTLRQAARRELRVSQERDRLAAM